MTLHQGCTRTAMPKVMLAAATKNLVLSLNRTRHFRGGEQLTAALLSTHLLPDMQLMIWHQTLVRAGLSFPGSDAGCDVDSAVAQPQHDVQARPCRVGSGNTA